MQRSQNNSSPCGGSLAASQDGTSTSIFCCFGYVLAWGYFRAALKWAAGLPEANGGGIDEFIQPELMKYTSLFSLSVSQAASKQQSPVFKSWQDVLKSYNHGEKCIELYMSAHLGQVFVYFMRRVYVYLFFGHSSVPKRNSLKLLLTPAVTKPQELIQ